MENHCMQSVEEEAVPELCVQGVKLDENNFFLFPRKSLLPLLALKNGSEKLISKMESPALDGNESHEFEISTCWP
jgi:hypothetical protein